MTKKKAAKKKEKKEEAPPESTLASMQYTQELKYGPGSVFKGEQLIKCNRIPFGVFAVDYATAGGIPVYGSTCLWGPKSGGKTTLGVSAMVSVDELCFRCFNYKILCSCSKSSISLSPMWIDIEGTFCKDWARNIGADPDKYFMALGDYGEMHINLAVDALKSTDCGLVVMDSLGSLVPESELEAPMEDQFYAVQARLISRCVRKIKQRLIRERKHEHPVAMLFVNQRRASIGGGKYGPTEKMPGGNAMEHEFSLVLRCIQVALSKEKDAKYIDSQKKLNSAAKFSVQIQKFKVSIVSGVAEYIRLIENRRDLGLRKGQVDDVASVLKYAKEHGVIQDKGSGKGWKYFDKTARVLKEIGNVWEKKPEEYLRTKVEIINRVKASLEE